MKATLGGLGLLGVALGVMVGCGPTGPGVPGLGLGAGIGAGIGGGDDAFDRSRSALDDTFDACLKLEEEFAHYPRPERHALGATTIYVIGMSLRNEMFQEPDGDRFRLYVGKDPLRDATLTGDRYSLSKMQIVDWKIEPTATGYHSKYVMGPLVVEATIERGCNKRKIVVHTDAGSPDDQITTQEIDQSGDGAVGHQTIDEPQNDERHEWDFRWEPGPKKWTVDLREYEEGQLTSATRVIETMQPGDKCMDRTFQCLDKCSGEAFPPVLCEPVHPNE